MPAIKRISIIIVQLITLSRACTALAFICVALIPHLKILAITLFIYSCLTDIIDGFLARKLSCTSKTGGALDLFSDKYLTIIAFVYAIARGLPVVPCAAGILREVFLLSLRSIFVDGKPLFPPQRILGTLTVIPIWSGTVLLLLYPDLIAISWEFYYYYYWTLGMLVSINLSYKVYINWAPFIKSFGD